MRRRPPRRPPPNPRTGTDRVAVAIDGLISRRGPCCRGEALVVSLSNHASPLRKQGNAAIDWLFFNAPGTDARQGRDPAVVLATVGARHASPLQRSQPRRRPGSRRPGDARLRSGTEGERSGRQAPEAKGQIVAFVGKREHFRHRSIRKMDTRARQLLGFRIRSLLPVQRWTG